MTRPLVGIVLAAGKGTRMKSELPKVLHPVLGKPMLQRVLESFLPLPLQKVVVVVGHQAQLVQVAVDTWNLPFPVAFVVQEPQLGTGHAVMQVVPQLPENEDVDVLITCGDMPLVSAQRYESLVATYREQNVKAVLVTVAMPNPTGYGRVIFHGDVFEGIVEEKDASPEEKLVPWINAGIYVGHWPIIAKYLGLLKQDNAQGEFYLTDVMGMLAKQPEIRAIAPVTWPSPDEVLGINSRAHLAQAGTILSAWTAQRLMEDGITLIQPQTMTLAPEIQIGPDTVLHPGCYLEGDVVIGRDCEIGPFTTMRGQIQVGNHCRIIQSYLDKAVVVGDNSYIGPFAHLRDNAVIGQTCRVGNFVEVKETRMGSRSNAAHLCYLGDADIGDEVNMGAGSIIANYDPILDEKHRTIIEDGVKVGCNCVLVAPVVIQQASCVAAGSVITDTVSPGDLAIARPRQTAVPGWVKRKRQSASGTPPNPNPVS